jgi:hypothetical protein
MLLMAFIFLGCGMTLLMFTSDGSLCLGYTFQFITRFHSLEEQKVSMSNTRYVQKNLSFSFLFMVYCVVGKESNYIPGKYPTTKSTVKILAANMHYKYFF